MDDARLTQQKLCALNHARLTPLPKPGDSSVSALEEYTARVLESRFLAEHRRRISARAAKAPVEPRAFLHWYEELVGRGARPADPLFHFVARNATREQLLWLVKQEIAGEAGIDDLVALTQVKMPTRAKHALAKIYWDEMGHGAATELLRSLAIRLEDEGGAKGASEDEVVWESLAVANLMTSMASNRSYAFHTVGALAVAELGAAGRAACVYEALIRLGYDDEARSMSYDAAHDRERANAWKESVILPLLEEDNARARAVAEGALMRMDAGVRCFERYRREMAEMADRSAGLDGEGSSPYSSGSYDLH